MTRTSFYIFVFLAFTCFSYSQTSSCPTILECSEYLQSCPAPESGFSCKPHPGVCTGAWGDWCEKTCRRRDWQCPPPDADYETRCPNGCQAGGRPIDFATGDTYIVQTDLALPGLAGGLLLQRTWHSLWPATMSPFQYGIFGRYWRTNYEERVFMGDDGTMKYSRGDGSFWSFGIKPNTQEWYSTAPRDAGAKLVGTATEWIITFKGGEQRKFNKNGGVLIAIIDRNSNTTTLAYDLDQVVTVTDPSGRYIHLHYAASHRSTPTLYFPEIVASATVSTGEIVQYEYDDLDRLIRVTYPDNTKITFEYDDKSMIVAVKDNEGKVLEAHTYDSFGRGLTSTRANGVDALTVTYPQ